MTISSKSNQNKEFIANVNLWTVRADSIDFIVISLIININFIYKNVSLIFNTGNSKCRMKNLLSFNLSMMNFI
jgi:hypothetical protein